MALIKWDKAVQAIQEATTVNELALIRNEAEAYRYAFKQAKEGTEVVNSATEIKLRAERKAGEFLKEMPKNKGSEGIGKSVVHNGDCTPKLSDLDITKNQSSKWQKMAAIPEEVFEDYIQEAET